MRSPARPRDDHLNPAPRSLPRKIRRPVRRPVCRRHIHLVSNPKLLQRLPRLAHNLEIRITPHHNRHKCLTHSLLISCNPAALSQGISSHLRVPSCSSWFSLDLLPQRPRRNILPIMRPVKTDLLASLIRSAHRSLQIPSPRRNSQHPSPRCIKLFISFRSPRMKNLHTLNRRSPIQSHNILPYLKRPRIPSRRHHHAYRRIRRPLKIPFAHPPLNRRFQRLHQVALQPHQNRLRLRIPKPAIELQHHWPPRRHHQPAIQNSSIFRALRLHPRYHRTRNVIHQPVPHLVVHDVGGRISSHAARVRPRIPIPV